MNIILRLSFVVLAFGLVVGCESPGRSLARSAVDQIKDGQTTKAEVDKIFGEPMQMTKSPEGDTLYLYQRFYGPDMYDSSGIAAPRRDESNLFLLSILMNPAGIVKKHLYSHTKPDIDQTLIKTGRKLGTEELGRIVPLKTMRADLAKWFGMHWSEELTLSGECLVSWIYADAYNLGARMEVQVLDVLLDDAGKVLTFRVTKRDPWRN
jgi:hypothetical protein